MEKVEFITGTFTDFTGRERNYVMAAVSMPENDGFDLDDKVLSIGVSVCRPNDAYNKELGIKIATGKARKYRDHALYTTDKGLINGTMVKALLEQEAKYFENNPGRYLAGYNSDMKKYLAKK